MARQSKGSVGKKDPKLIARTNAVYSCHNKAGQHRHSEAKLKNSPKLRRKRFFLYVGNYPR